MSMEWYNRSQSIVCDYCGKRLPLEWGDGAEAAHKKRCDAGWETRRVKDEILDICDDCIFEEKGYSDK